MVSNLILKCTSLHPYKSSQKFNQWRLTYRILESLFFLGFCVFFFWCATHTQPKSLAIIAMAGDWALVVSAEREVAHHWANNRLAVENQYSGLTGFCSWWGCSPLSWYNINLKVRSICDLMCSYLCRIIIPHLLFLGIEPHTLCNHRIASAAPYIERHLKPEINQIRREWIK